MEELQRNSSINHGLVTEQDVEQKSKELRMLGDTLTELKSKSCLDTRSVWLNTFLCVFAHFCVATYFHHHHSKMSSIETGSICILRLMEIVVLSLRWILVYSLQSHRQPSIAQDQSTTGQLRERKAGDFIANTL